MLSALLRHGWFCIGVLLLAAAFRAAVIRAEEEPAWEADEPGYRKTIEPFFRKHCLDCHGPQEKQGNLRLDTDVPNRFLDRAAKEKWGEIVNVLNSHQMPPEDRPQPDPEQVADVTAWITAQMARAELVLREGVVVLRRLNRDEYRNTIRDLIGVDFDPSGFPQDPPAGGFDNNGRALTLSPLHLELYLDAARKILDRALVEGEQPRSIRWRFEIDSGDSDSNRVRFEDQNPIVNGGNNPVRDGFKVVHHANWDKGLNARDFRLPSEGEYIIRIRAGGVVPNRDQVVESARRILADRRDKQIQENPKGEKWHHEQFDRDLRHFQTDRMYDYGSPRLKLVQALGGQPRTLAELDVDAPRDKPAIYEVQARFTRESAGLTIEYAYDIPRVLENFWFQGHDAFARPELWVDWFEIEGPVYASWPPASHRQIISEAADAISDERERAEQVLTHFMRRCWRRPVSKSEVEDKLKLYDLVRGDSPSFVQAIKTPLSAVMVSPHFLYLAEPELPAKPAKGKEKSSPGRKLNDHELAARLSYFLWSSMPDEELMRLASKRQLRDAKTLTAQVDRLLADPRSDALVRNFAGQWLGLREVGANPPAPDLYPQYDRHLETSIVAESRAFFREILQHDLSAMNFVRSDFVVINERLARFYGIPEVRGDHFRRVTTPIGVRRGGVVTQAAVLTITSNGTRTSPVKRGTWILKNLLGTDPGLPVANAGDIAPKVPGIDKATVRQRLEIHRTLPQCARCHSKIDPLGFALENFNASGEWRDQEGFGYKGRIEANDPAIDASSKLPDGTQITGVADLQQALLDREDLFLNCLAGKLTTYALGRELAIADQPRVDAAVRHMKQHNYTLRSLIQFIVTSEAFRTR